LDDTKVYQDALEDAYGCCIEKMFCVFVNGLATGQPLDEAGQKFKAGVELTNQAFDYAKQLMEG